jgi:hypothetical protein
MPRPATIKMDKRGCKIKWKAVGKTAKLYGVHGKVLTATVVGQEKIDGELYYRTTRAYGPMSGHLVPVSDVLFVG